MDEIRILKEHHSGRYIGLDVHKHYLIALGVDETLEDVVVGQVYWPIQDDINLEWAQICLPFDEWIYTFISNKKGWNTFVLDLSNFEALESQRALNDFKLPGIVLQGVLKSTNPNLKTTPVFVDSIQLFVNGQE